MRNHLLNKLKSNLLAALLSSALPYLTNAASFTGLGDLPGGKVFSLASDISDDGTKVVGYSISVNNPEDTTEAFLWTEDGGMIGLGDLPGGQSYSVPPDGKIEGAFSSRANGLSADGSTVVGRGTSAIGQEAFIWTESGGMKSLGESGIGIPNLTQAYDVSADGSTVLGSTFFGNRGGTIAAVWTEIEGITKLGSRGNISSNANGISADGSIVVGLDWVFSDIDFGGFSEAFIWTQNSGMAGLGYLPAPDDLWVRRYDSRAAGISANGIFVVGRSTSFNAPFASSFWHELFSVEMSEEAFLWSADQGMIGLGDLPGGRFNSAALSVSDNGSTIVGYGNNDEGGAAAIWDSENGIRSLSDVLEKDLGLEEEIEGWNLYTATAITPDGRFIIGTGTNPSGDTEAWRVDLGTCCERSQRRIKELEANVEDLEETLLFVLEYGYDPNANSTTKTKIVNGNFETEIAPWKFFTNGSASASLIMPDNGSNGAVLIEIADFGTNTQLFQNNINLQPNTEYELTFDAKAPIGSPEYSLSFEVSLANHKSPYTDFGLNRVRAFATGLTWNKNKLTFTTKNFKKPINDARLYYWFAPDRYGQNIKIMLDNVELVPTGQ